MVILSHSGEGDHITVEPGRHAHVHVRSSQFGLNLLAYPILGGLGEVLTCRSHCNTVHTLTTTERNLNGLFVGLGLIGKGNLSSDLKLS